MPQVRFLNIPGRQTVVLFNGPQVAMEEACCCCPCWPWVTSYEVSSDVTSDVAEWECTLEDGCIANFNDDTIDVRACEPFGPDYDFPPVIRRKTRIEGLLNLEFAVTLEIDPETCCFTEQETLLGTVTKILEVDVAHPDDYDDWMLPPCYGSRPTPTTLTATIEYEVYLVVTCNTVSLRYDQISITDPCDFIASSIWLGYFGICAVSTGNLFTTCDNDTDTCCMPDPDESCPTHWTNTSDIESCVTLTWTGTGLL